MPNPAAARRQSGLSLVELMVGMLIGLIGIIIITHLYVTNEQYKRSTTATGAAQANGAIALYTIERDLRMAGYGLNMTEAFDCGCNPVANPGCSAVQYFYGGTYSFPPAPSAGGAREALALYPVIITATPGQADSIAVFYGSDNERVLATRLDEAMAGPGGDLTPNGGVDGFEAPNATQLGNLVVAVNGTTCAMFYVTGLPPSVTPSLAHAPDVTRPWNPPGGGPPSWAFPQNSLLFNLGSAPVWRVYQINNNRLQVRDQLQMLVAGGTAQDLMNGIVDLQAQYGKDTSSPADGVPDVWDKTFPASGTQWAQVIAVRVGLLARGENYERPSTPGGACTATQVAPTWSGGTFNIPGGLPSCYKYTAFETVIPLRNMIWRP